jgi:hypothetical protein
MRRRDKREYVDALTGLPLLVTTTRRYIVRTTLEPSVPLQRLLGTESSVFDATFDPMFN